MPPITPDRWRILSPYLDEALDIAADQRPAWLASISERDAALATDLKAMLAEHEVVNQAGFMDGAVLDSQITHTRGSARSSSAAPSFATGASAVAGRGTATSLRCSAPC